MEGVNRHEKIKDGHKKKTTSILWRHPASLIQSSETAHRISALFPRVSVSSLLSCKDKNILL